MRRIVWAPLVLLHAIVLHRQTLQSRNICASTAVDANVNDGEAFRSIPPGRAVMSYKFVLKKRSWKRSMTVALSYVRQKTYLPPRPHPPVLKRLTSPCGANCLHPTEDRGHSLTLLSHYRTQLPPPKSYSPRNVQDMANPSGSDCRRTPTRASRLSIWTAPTLLET